jgi:hypothetical protein
MTTQVIEIGRPAVRWEAPRRPRVSVAGARDAIRLLLAVIVLLLGLCVAGTFASAGSSSMPPDGPAPGLDL